MVYDEAAHLRKSNLTLDGVYAILAEFLIELRLHEEQDKITQIVNGSSTPVKHSMYDEYAVQARGKCLSKEKASRRVAKAHSLNGDPHAKTTGSQMVAHKVIIVQSIMRGAKDAQSVDPLDILPHSVLVQ